MTKTNHKPMLANDYDNHSVLGWLMSEKLDGVRAFWNGKKLFSRNGNEFFAPDSFISQLPSGIALDGELFIGRGELQAVASIVRKKLPVAAEWSQVSFRVFDAPMVKGGFKTRIAAAEKATSHSQVASVISHVECDSKQHAINYMNELCLDGAEGIVLRDPSSKYEGKRSNKFLKLKPASSAEASVIGFSQSALIVEWNGISFNVAFTSNAPFLGDSITFEYSGLTDKGCPRCVKFVTVRNYE